MNPDHLKTAQLIGDHAGVRVWRFPGGPEGRYLKVVAEAARGRREAALLEAALPMQTPRLREHGYWEEGGWFLRLDEARHTGERAGRRLSAEGIPAAAAVLAALHRQRLPFLPPPEAWIRRWQHLDPRLSSSLKQALAAVPLCGDAPCHLDLHPSNWILENGLPVGLMDWSSAGYADPEVDLAALLFAAFPEQGWEEETLRHRLSQVCHSWEVNTEREADWSRILLYFWRMCEERTLQKGVATTSVSERLVSAVMDGRAVHGQYRRPRLYAKQEQEGKSHPARSPWEPIGDPALLRQIEALDLEGPVTSYTRHACNDIFRLGPGGERILKVYNKPVYAQMFALEQWLSERLDGSPAAVASPLPFRDNRRVLRIGGRLAVLYPYLEGKRPGNRGPDLEKLAAAMSALHLQPVQEAFPDLPSNDLDQPWQSLATHAEALGSTKAEQIQEVHQYAETALQNCNLNYGLIHGSLHQDHCIQLGDGRLALLDLEKLSRGPMLTDAVWTAVYAGYRGNDEQADPRRILYFLRAYARNRPWTPAEKIAVVPLILRMLLRDVKALGQDHAPLEQQRAHAQVVWLFYRNRENLRSGVDAFV